MSDVVAEHYSERLNVATLDLMVQPTADGIEPDFMSAVQLYEQLCADSDKFAEMRRALQYQAVLQPLRASLDIVEALDTFKKVFPGVLDTKGKSTKGKAKKAKSKANNDDDPPPSDIAELFAWLAAEGAAAGKKAIKQRVSTICAVYDLGEFQVDFATELIELKRRFDRPTLEQIESDIYKGRYKIGKGGSSAAAAADNDNDADSDSEKAEKKKSKNKKAVRVDDSDSESDDVPPTPPRAGAAPR